MIKFILNNKPYYFINGKIYTPIQPNLTTEISLKQDIYNDEHQRNLDEDLYLNPTPTSMLDRTQTITTPSVSGNMNVNWTKYPNYAALSRWRKMQAVIAQNRANGHVTNYDTITLFGSDNYNFSKYAGGVLLPDGRVCVVPNYPTHEVVILDVQNLVIDSYFGYGDFLYGDRYVGGVLLPDGKVCYIPYQYRKDYVNDPIKISVAVVDPINQTFTKTYLTDLDQYYQSGVLLPDGRVCCIPYHGGNGFIFDSIKQSENYIPLNVYSEWNFFGSVLLPDGRVCCVPADSYQWGILDPIGKNFNKYGLGNSQTEKYSGGVLIEDERVLAIPYDSKYFINIFNPRTFDIEQHHVNTNQYNQYNQYSGGVLLPDGRVLYTPYYAHRPMIVDPILLTYNYLPFDSPNNNGWPYFQGGTLLPDGRILWYPQECLNFAIISASDGNYGVLPDLDTCLSAYLNKF